MSTLRGRIGLVLLVFGLVTLIAVGGALWVVLRELHRDAALGSLAQLTVPYSNQARQQIPQAVARALGTGEEGGNRPGERPNAGPREDSDRDDLAEFVRATQEEIEVAGISVLFVNDGSVIVRDPETGTVGTSVASLGIDLPTARGVVQTGSVELEDRGAMLYAATSIRNPRPLRASPTLVLLRVDDSAELATTDLVRSLLVAGLLLVIVGIPMAVGLSRSVTGPLRRLSAATGTVARGKVPEPLPTTGPIEVAEASAAFNAMAAEVGATREAQRQLLADIRHDLRTPLTVISGFSEALRDGTATGEVADRAASAISDEAGRLERMLDDLDHLTVPGVAGPPLRLETLDSLEVARSAVERFVAEADSRQQEIVVVDGAVSAPLTADRDMLDRILGNIIANALSHAPSPGGHVSVETLAAEGRVTLAVCDDGPGIPSAALPHVFDRFYRVDPSRTNPGSGLGLAIVRDLAEALGGEAFAENVDGQGARVGVILPATPTSAEPTARP